jgi:NAD(P)-dependent dehydrogenase (short-subunit alcohol dehydrogenase family)
MILEEFKLEGNVAILTGYGQSWPKYLGLALAEAGATVVTAGSEQKQIESGIEEIRKLGRKAMAIPTDLTSAREIQNMIDQAVSQFGKIDILVNNLNLEFGKPFLEVTEGEWKRVIDTNLTAVFLCSKAVGKHMVEQRAGKIVNIVSGGAERGLPNGTAYCASMGGVVQLTRALALEWARKNVRVNAVGVGWMENSFAGKQEDSVAHYIPMRRRGRPEDIAPLVVFLASNASSYLSGQVYFVDGGLMARS